MAKVATQNATDNNLSFIKLGLHDRDQCVPAWCDDLRSDGDQPVGHPQGPARLANFPLEKALKREDIDLFPVLCGVGVFEAFRNDKTYALRRHVLDGVSVDIFIDSGQVEVAVYISLPCSPQRVSFRSP